MKSRAVPLPNVYHLSFLIPVYMSLAGLFTITLMDFSILHLDTPQKIVPASPSKACLIPFLCSFQPVSYCCNLPQLCCKIQACLFPVFVIFSFTSSGTSQFRWTWILAWMKEERTSGAQKFMLPGKGKCETSGFQVDEAGGCSSKNLTDSLKCAPCGALSCLSSP